MTRSARFHVNIRAPFRRAGPSMRRENSRPYRRTTVAGRRVYPRELACGRGRVSDVARFPASTPVDKCPMILRSVVSIPEHEYYADGSIPRTMRSPVTSRRAHVRSTFDDSFRRAPHARTVSWNGISTFSGASGGASRRRRWRRPTIEVPGVYETPRVSDVGDGIRR